MYLFFNGVSSAGYIALFSKEREKISSITFNISGSESTKTISVIDNFIKAQDIKYTDIDTIVTIVGPGSFTGLRTVILVVNSLAYIYPHLHLSSLPFFDLYSSYPVVKTSSKRDLFVKMKKSDTIQVLSNSDFESQYRGRDIYGDINVDRFNTQYTLNEDIDYEKIFRKTELKKLKKLTPFYVKKPNIS